MQTKTKKILVSVAAAAIALYLIMPIVAGIFEIGNRWGPKIYPIWLHETLYMIAWEMSSHEGGKPRIGVWYREEYRPWFYGMYSRNDDPDFISQGIEEFKKKHGQ